MPKRLYILCLAASCALLLSSKAQSVTSGPSPVTFLLQKAYQCKIESGQVLCKGQIGSHFSSPTFSPVPKANKETISLSGGQSHLCILKSNGNLGCLGDNTRGQLGIGSSESAKEPQFVKALRGAVRSVSSGENHTCALLNNKTVSCWGDNSQSQLGVTLPSAGTFSVSPVPLPLSDVTFLISGEFHTCALSPKSSSCWGANKKGQLSISHKLFNQPPIIKVPKKVTYQSLAPIIQMSTTKENTCLLTQKRNVYCFGSNSSGQLGTQGVPYRKQLDPNVNINEHPPMSPTPMLVIQNDGQALHDVSHIAITPSVGIALKKDASLWGWGTLPKGSKSEPVLATPLKKLSTKKKIKHMQTNQSEICFIYEDESHKCEPIKLLIN